MDTQRKRPREPSEDEEGEEDQPVPKAQGEEDQPVSQSTLPERKTNPPPASCSLCHQSTAKIRVVNWRPPIPNTVQPAQHHVPDSIQSLVCESCLRTSVGRFIQEVSKTVRHVEESVSGGFYYSHLRCQRPGCQSSGAQELFYVGMCYPEDSRKLFCKVIFLLSISLSHVSLSWGWGITCIWGIGMLGANVFPWSLCMLYGQTSRRLCGHEELSVVLGRKRTQPLPGVSRLCR